MNRKPTTKRGAGLARRISGAALVVVTLILAACQGTKAEGPAGNWRASMDKVRMVIQANDADPDAIRRADGYRRYFAEITGLEVELFKATDYNGVIQALAAGQVDVAQFGGGAYANVDAQVGDLVAPILVVREAEGNTGYYSALTVKASSPFRTIDDLRGKVIGYPDFNSTSGYVYPRQMMRQQGKDPDRFFGESVMAGGHIEVMMALTRGQVDAAMVFVSGGTPEFGFSTGSLFTLARQDILKLEDYRMIWIAGPIPNSPVTIRTDRPQAFIDLIRGGLAALPYEDPAVWADVGQREGGSMAAVNRATYQDIIDMRSADMAERRDRGREGAR